MEIRLSLSKSFHTIPEDIDKETLKLTTPIFTAIVYKHQLCFNFCFPNILYPFDRVIYEIKLQRK